jgi:hypothetical protein
MLINCVVAEAIKEGIEAVGGTADILQYVAPSQLFAVAKVNSESLRPFLRKFWT